MINSEITYRVEDEVIFSHLCRDHIKVGNTGVITEIVKSRDGDSWKIDGKVVSQIIRIRSTSICEGVYYDYEVYPSKRKIREDKLNQILS